MAFIRGAAAWAVAGVGALAATAGADTTLFSTGFEQAQGYTNNTQLATNSNWIGDGQDTSGWLITNSTVGGSGAASGSQWVLASGATSSVTKFQWTVQPVTDFSTLSTIVGSVDCKLASPSSGTINRSTVGGLAMYDAAVNFIGGISLIIDTENLAGLGANRALIEMDYGDGDFDLFDLGTSSLLNTYLHLDLSVNFQTDTVTGAVNGVALPASGSAGGATDFHDLDMVLGSASTTSGGTRARGGFDNYSVTQVPEPASIMMILAGVAGFIRRR